MFRWLKKRSRWAFGSGLSTGLLVGVGMLIGALATRSQPGVPPFPLGGRLNATATHGGATFGMCTGSIYEGMEGVFFLDYLTGELQCWVPNARSGLLGGVYKQNVLADRNVEVGGSVKPSFLMVTGGYALRTGFVENVKPADCLIYVADANSGAWVAYAIPWNRAVANAGVMQAGQLVRVGQGKARQLALRD